MKRLLATAAALLLLAAGTSRAVAQQRPLLLSRLAWFDRSGTQLSAVGPLADHGNVELSPDGTRIAVAVSDGTTGTRNIWIYEADGRRTLFTTDAADENWMIWSGDGGRVVFNAFSEAMLSLIEAPALGGGERRTILADAAGKWPVSWSPDGDNILFVTNSRQNGNDVWVLPMSGNRRPFAFAATEAAENWATFSPNGRWVAYSSTAANGSAEVYIAPFPPTGRAIRVSADGGTQARWRAPNEILYLDSDRRLMAATIRDAGSEIAVTGIVPLFRMTYPFGAYHAFDVTNDGRRILANTVVSANAPTQNVSASRRQRPPT